MDEFKQLFREGEDYLNQLEKIDFRTSKLGDEVVYNMICLSAEAMLTAILLKHGSLVEHGSITAMLRKLSMYEPVRVGLIQDVRLINKYHVWCSLDKITPPKMNPDDMMAMLKSVREIHASVSPLLA